MVLFKIAFKGMKGRKKDTLLLFMVVILSFAFIVSATMFYAGIAGTEEKNRLKTYGKWQAAYMSGDKETVEFLKNIKHIDTMSVCSVVDLNTDAGVIGTADENLLELGNISMLCGNMPKEGNEIALELPIAAEMGVSEEDIGKDILVSSRVIGVVTQQEELQAYYRKQRERYGQNTNYYEANNVTPISSDDNIAVSYMESYTYLGPQCQNQDEIIENGYITMGTFVVTRYFKLSGIVETYSDRWDTGSYIVPSAFITEASAENYNEIFKKCVFPNGQKQAGSTIERTYSVFLYSNELGEDLYSNLKEPIMEYISKKEANQIEEEASIHAEGESDSAAFRKNNLAYPGNINKQKQILVFAVMAGIFLVSAISIFQLYLTQVRRRGRTFSLLKSIGSTNKQVISVFLYEGLILLVIGMPIGVLLGIGLSYGAVEISTLLKGTLMVGFIPSLVGAGIAACSLSLIAGMLVPIIYALNIPLTGVIEKPISHHKNKREISIGESLIKQPSSGKTLRFINSTHRRLNRGKSAMTFGLSLVTCLLMVFSILSGYICHDKYIDEVLYKGKPDYVCEYFYGVNSGWLGRANTRHNNIRGVEKQEAIWQGNDLHLYYDGIEKDEIVNSFKECLPDTYKRTYFGHGDSDGVDVRVDNALITNFYALPEAYDVMEKYAGMTDKLMASVTDGTVDKQAFDEGHEVIVMLPMYAPIDEKKDADTLSVLQNSSFQEVMVKVLEESGKYNFSYDKDKAEGMQKNMAIKPGDTIYVCADKEIQIDNTIKHIYEPVEVKVGGIIRYFQGERPWPFSETKQGYVVLGSESLMYQLYTGYGTLNYNEVNKNSVNLINKTIAKVRLGKTLVYVYGNSMADYEHTDRGVAKLSDRFAYVLGNYRVTNQIILSEARNNTAIIGLLCITSAVLAMIILYNILSSLADQDRKRIGILQSIGVTRKELRLIQLRKGVSNGLVSLVIINVVLAGAIYGLCLINAAQTGESINTALYKVGAYYPFGLHVAVVIIYMVATVLMYYLPFRKAINSSPVENISQ